MRNGRYIQESFNEEPRSLLPVGRNFVASGRSDCARNSDICGLRLFRHQAPHAKLGHTAISDYVLLPEGEASTYAKLFSASSKTDVQSWEPTVADIESLEANLVLIPTLSENVAGSTRHIDKPEQYFRQYLAVVQHGKRWIFVNALCRIDERDSDAWRKHLEMIVDGGECYWQAWYDPATRRFSNLLVNGVA